MKETVAGLLRRSAEVLVNHAELNSGTIVAMGEAISNSLRAGGKLILFGNGGSAADAQHLAAELVGAYLRRDRRALPAIALTVNTSILTAVGNDYGYDEIFRRQLEGLARPGDIVLGISTSGNSPNVNLALTRAREMELVTLGFSGKGGGGMHGLCDLLLVVPSDHTPHIQEAHIASGHIICGLIEEALT